MKIRKIDCPYCRLPMRYLGNKRIQLGKSGIIFEHLDHWLSGALPVSIYECPGCGKYEFFRSDMNTKRKKDKNDTIIDI